MSNYLDILAETIRNNWDAPALTDFYLMEDGKAQDTSRGNHYTYGEMYAEIVRVANLLTNLGMQKGDHIVICGANSSHWVIAYLAIAQMQGVSVVIMPSLQIDNIVQMVDFSDAKALFVGSELCNEFKEKSLPKVKSVISLDDWSILYGENQIINHKFEILNGECGFPYSKPDNLAMICFTSGSTGGAKGVMLSNRSISNNSKDFHNLYPYDANKNYISLCPFAHLSGFMGDFISQLTFGKHVYIPQDIISTNNIYTAFSILRPYMYISVPHVLKGLIEKYGDNLFNEFKPYCRLFFVGGAALEKDCEKSIVNSSIPLAIVYGQTETGASIAITPYQGHCHGSCGKIVEGMTCRIAPNGEIIVKGENVMLGYYKDPEATAAKIDKDGWLHTGDKGHLDEDGYLYVEGRLEQDIIVLPNGENIRPDNIEAFINALPEVKESIVFARDGKLVAIVVSDQQSVVSNQQSVVSLRREILRTVNPQLPLFSQLYDVEITDQPLQRTEKQTIKRYLYS